MSIVTCYTQTSVLADRILRRLGVSPPMARVHFRVTPVTGGGQHGATWPLLLTLPRQCGNHMKGHHVLRNRAGVFFAMCPGNGIREQWRAR